MVSASETGTKASLWALAAFVFGFYFQVHAGHLVFEKRKPALVDGFVEVRATPFASSSLSLSLSAVVGVKLTVSCFVLLRLSQAMLAAPLFVWLEVIFFLGFRKTLQHEVEAKAAKLIEEYKKQDGKTK